MAVPSTIGVWLLFIGVVEALALTAGGLMRLVRPLAPIAGRLLICSSVAGALGVAVGLCVFLVAVVWLNGRDDTGLLVDALAAYFVGAGLGVPVFATREWFIHDNAA